ncbi:MAG: FAD-dependent oxidoreductase [Syntrophales bacterium]
MEYQDHAVREKAGVQLKAFFGKIPHEIVFYLFTSPGENEPFNQAARQVIRAFHKMTAKIVLRERNLDHADAKKWNVGFSPTLLLDPGQYNVRWLGAPVGEETRTLVEAIGMMGYRRYDLSDQSLKILKRIDSPRHIRLFVSPTCPYCPQQAVNALKAAFARPELVSLEIIDVQANPELARKYSAQSVPRTYANEKFVAEGAQPEELFMLSLEKLKQQNVFIPESDAAEVETDLVIIGGGPAGLTAGIYATRSGMRTAVIERGILGGQVATTPVVENYPGLTQIGGKTLVDIMVSHALEYTRIFPGEEVIDIKPGDPSIVLTSRRRFKTRMVLLATGASHRRLDVPGEARFFGRGVSYCSTCDGPLFSGKKVIMVGGGDSAVTEALNLRNIGVDVTIVHRNESLKAQKYLLLSLEANRIPVLFHTEVRQIRGKDQVEAVELFDRQTGESSIMEVEGVFVAIGYDPNTELARKIGVEITPQGYIKHDERHRTNIPGIYSAGDVEGGYKQIVIAAAKGSEAALAIFEDFISPYWKKEADLRPRSS